MRKTITKKHLVDDSKKKKDKKQVIEKEDSDNETSRYLNFKSKKEKNISKY